MIIAEMPMGFSAEKEVEHYYSTSICDLLKCPYTSRFLTDGIYYNETDKIKILAEYKVFGDLINNKSLLCRCIIQIMCYIKKVEDSGELLPNIIFIANEKNFVIFDSSVLLHYMSYVNSQMVPSEMFETPPKELLNLLMENIIIPIFDILQLSLLPNIIQGYKGKTKGLKMSINNNNMTRIFETFITSKIVTNMDNKKEEKNQLTKHEEVALFASIIFNECNDIVGKPNQILTPITDKRIVKIKRINYDKFLLSINSIEKPSSKNVIIAEADRLIEEVSRRFYGEYYTPKKLVTESYKIIEKIFGLDWKTKYIVWDTCSGTGNLTRDAMFKELYSSTLFQSDIDIMNQRDYNSTSIKFQYDFLNDDVHPTGVLGMGQDKLSTVAPNLVDALSSNKSIIIFMNPPYGQPKDGIYANVSTKNMNKTNIRDLMITDKLGNSSKQLYIQFLYRILMLRKKYKNDNIHICMFSDPKIITSVQNKKFREIFLKNYQYKESFYVNSGSFSDSSDIWGILFSVWKDGTENILYEIESTVLNSKQIEKKLLYNLDDKLPAAYWIRNLDKEEVKEVPVFSSGLIITDNIKQVPKSSFGHFLEMGHDVNCAIFKTSLFTGAGSVGTPITKKNYYNVISLFTAKNMLLRRWYTMTDQFIAPHEEHPEYKQWNVDCIVYSLFKGSSQQTSIRGNLVIENEFFWLSNNFMKELADNNGFDGMYQDSNLLNQERFVFKEMQKVELSQDAQNVLSKATELTVKSIFERKRMHSLHPEWHLNAWDAGWYQIKKILEASFENELNEFDELFKIFQDRMKSGVYKFGFLK